MNKQEQQKPSRQVIQIFHFPPFKPVNEGVYFCVIKVKDKTSLETEVHYAFVAFKDEEFMTPKSDNREVTVEAWSILEDPIVLFEKPKPPQQAKRIILPRINRGFFK